MVSCYCVICIFLPAVPYLANLALSIEGVELEDVEECSPEIVENC